MPENIPEIIASEPEAAFFMLPDFQRRIVEGARRIEKVGAESAWTVTKDPLNPGKYNVLPLIYGSQWSVKGSFDDNSALNDPAGSNIQLNAVGRFHFHPRNSLSFSTDDIGFLEQIANGVKRSSEQYQDENGVVQFSNDIVRSSLPNVIKGELYNIVFEPGFTYGLFAPVIKLKQSKPIVEQVRYLGVSGSPKSNLYQRLLFDRGTTRGQIDTLNESGFKVSYLELPLTNGTPLWDKVSSIISGQQKGK